MVEMALANQPNRTRKATVKAVAAATCGVKKRCSPRLKLGKAVRYAIGLEDFECQSTPNSALPEVQKRRRHLIEDSASDSESEDEPESEELDTLSGDNIEYNSRDQLDHRESYDSRLESGNEEYELDDFVVDDDEVDDISDVSSVVTITPESFGEERRLSLASLGESSQWDFEVQPVMSDFSASDVAEEITDAVCRFSRRCNRNCAPLHLVLASEMLEDKEVVDSLQSAIKQGLGQFDATRDNNVLVVVGPKKYLRNVHP
ncbi:hypothetical protein FB567DRAFT_619134 [Paraphoma chrysanthemicola]|uniref:Uncharacterized protein n=1 Tax=Paraphoma chrysanthemicola TaxID=798071 RepID=A0A8K0W023_9PLEO|nr:hypothetical protein FB567DRAFT_619134 [Paraphoma chrysanthemicola]